MNFEQYIEEFVSESENTFVDNSATIVVTWKCNVIN